jgi:hypothetical protein
MMGRMSATTPTHVYDVRPRSDKRGFDLISDVLPFGRLWYEQAPHAIEYAKFYSRSHNAVIRDCDQARNVIETHEQTGQFKEVVRTLFSLRRASTSVVSVAGQNV